MSASRQCWMTAGVFLFLAVLYGVTAGVHVSGNDNGEFAVIACQGGIAHPSGYPLYSLYLRATSWFPGSTPAHAAGLATALLGWLSSFILFLAARRWRMPWWAALVSAGLFGVSTQVWLAHTYAEVFALNHLLAASILLLTAPDAPLRGARRILALGSLAGLALAHHHSAVLLFPIGLWGVWSGMRESERKVLGLLGGVGALVALAVLPHAYFFWADGCVDCMKWGSFDTWADVWHHASRADYGTTRLSIDGEYVPFAQLGTWVVEVAGDFGFLGFGLALLGLLALRDQTEDRRARIALAATLLTTGPLFVMLFNHPLDGIGLEMVKRYHTLSEVVLALFAGIGLSWFWEEYPTRRKFGPPAVAFLVCMLLAVGWIRTREFHAPVIENYASNTLSTVSRGAVILGTGDHRYYGINYVQRCLNVRTDVTYLDAALLGYDWYRPRMGERLGVEVPAPETLSDGAKRFPIVAFVAGLQDAGIPVFVADRFTEKIFDAYPTFPVGTVHGVMPPGVQPPPGERLVVRNLDLWDAFRFEPLKPTLEHNAWGWHLYLDYARQWRELAEHCTTDRCRRVARQQADAYALPDAPEP